jgi:hypothetical protein
MAVSGVNSLLKHDIIVAATANTTKNFFIKFYCFKLLFIFPFWFVFCRGYRGARYTRFMGVMGSFHIAPIAPIALISRFSLL